MFQPEPIDQATWPKVYEVIAPAIARADFTVPELIDELLAQTAQLWVLRKGGDPIAVAVTELVQSPKGRFVHGRLLAGHGMDEWVDDLIACMRRYANASNATRILIEGRDGWERVLGNRGWRRSAVVMELALEGTA